ncbi:MAG: endonuclease III [Clostridiales bacterium]|jgi:endonuclease-3|nr:endonuclease III [Clostridiales bacterium]
MNKITKAKKISKLLEKIYVDAKCELNFKNSIELLIAAQLSAQCTDKLVNNVTKNLFKKYKNVSDYAKSNANEFSNDIKQINYFNNKAKNIIGACKILVQKFDGNIPNNMEKLLKLPGVGRKTANLILGEIFDIPGIVVDTHVKRLSNRLGLVSVKNPQKIEFELMEIIPKNTWNKFCHQLIFHGRRCCLSRFPKCYNCQIKMYCETFSTNSLQN